MTTMRYLVLTLLIAACGIPQWGWSQPYQRSTVTDEAIAFNTLALDNSKVHYAYAGDVEQPGVLFVHGTPGGWGAFEIYLENKAMQNDFFMVSVDRLGWGESSLPENQRLDGNFDKQADAIIRIMRNYPSKKWIIVGHSLGASLAPKIALANPEKVSALLLLAGSLNPKLGKPRWYNFMASTWVVSKLIGQMMVNSNREIMGLKKQLKVMSDAIADAKLDVKLSIMQGMKDKLVSPKNTAYVDSAWRPHFASVDIIELPDEGHFLPWRQTPLVIETIRSLAK